MQQNTTHWLINNINSFLIVLETGSLRSRCLKIRRRLLRVPWTARRSNQSILKEISPGISLEGMMLKLRLQYFGHLMWRADSLEKTLMLGGIGAGGEGDDRGWDGWMASLTRWTWVWVNSGSWWWTGRPGVLRFMGLQRVGHDRATDLIWSDLRSHFLVCTIFSLCPHMIERASEFSVSSYKGMDPIHENSDLMTSSLKVPSSYTITLGILILYMNSGWDHWSITVISFLLVIRNTCKLSSITLWFCGFWIQD